MKRRIYASGIDGVKICEWANECEYWLLSVTYIRRKSGLPIWLKPYITPKRKVLYDPGTFSASKKHATFEQYLEFIDEHLRPQDEYLQYDVMGNAQITSDYYDKMLAKGYNPIPVFQPGGDTELFKLPRVAVGGVVPMEFDERTNHFNHLFHEVGISEKTDVHVLGMWKKHWFERFPFARGDSSEWIRNRVDKRRDDWETPLNVYGEQEIEYKPKFMWQECLF